MDIKKIGAMKMCDNVNNAGTTK